MGTNVTFCSARCNFKTCDFTSGDVNVSRVTWQYCRARMHEMQPILSDVHRVHLFVSLSVTNALNNLAQ